jgi:hypothetical protein
MVVAGRFQRTGRGTGVMHVRTVPPRRASE